MVESSETSEFYPILSQLLYYPKLYCVFQRWVRIGQIIRELTFQLHGDTMNVMEKQKEMLIQFMEQHFGQGRLRYNKENKRKIDELWEKLSSLNTSAYGPQTWRDWKANTLKKVAKHKIYMMGTGGGSPKDLQLSGSENVLLNFLTPDASGLRDISEGGFTDMTPSYEKTSNSFALSSNIEEKEDEVFSLDTWNDTMMASHEMYSSEQNTQNIQSCMSLNSNIHPFARHLLRQTPIASFLCKLFNIHPIENNKNEVYFTNFI